MKKNQLNMKGDYLRLLLFIVAVLGLGVADFVYGDAGCCRASATGTGISAKAPLVNTKLGISNIGCNGGNKTNSSGSAAIPGLLTAGVVDTSASGTTTATNSSARVDNILVTAGGNVITATQLTANAQTSCSGNPTGSSTIQNLSVNGNPVNVTGDPNQEVPIPGGKIILNAQNVKTSNGGCVKNITVTALKISLLGVADISIASSHAGIACIVFSCS